MSNIGDMLVDVKGLEYVYDKIKNTLSTKTEVTNVDNKFGEVTSARQSGTGTTYNNLKARLDADKEAAEQDISALKADLGAIETSLLSQIEYSPVNNKAVNPSTGEMVASSTYCCTDYIDVSKYTILSFARIGTTSANADKGTAFYDNTKTFISGSGIPNLTNQAQLGYTEYSVAIPKTAKYVRFTYIKNNADGFFVKGVPFVDEEVEEIKNAIVGKRVPITPTYTTETGYIRYYDGEFISGGSAFATSMIDVSAYEQMEYPRLYSTSSSSSAGMAFYDENGTYISGERCSLNNETLHYESTEIKVPTGAKYARFTGNNNATGNFVFANSTSVYNSLQGQIDNVNERIDGLIYVPSKKVSILGDSISTFALEAGTGSGDKYAEANCKTNYPGNRVRYPFNDVLNVNQMWWKIVLDHFGWTLGINDSWAGSRIAWEDDESTTTGANIYIGSPTRIGHLDDNGIPDLIFIFGGTNDINHLGTSNIGELPTEDPTGYTQSDLDALPVDKFKDAVVAMILRIQYAYPSAQIIALVPYFVNQNYSTTPYTVKQFDDALIECYDYLGVDYIDLRKIVNVYDITTLLGDNLHPNANGMKLIAEAVIHKIKNVIQISPH